MASFFEDSLCYRISPWKDMAEFTTVYNWLYDANSDRDSKKQAMDMMRVWKIRRLHLTPASILGTMEILSAQLADDQSKTDSKDIEQLQAIYSSMFTRFLNHMSSILQGRSKQTMYNIAKELGLESVLVDLRHTCSHGQVIPSIDVYRRTAKYCMNWLHDFYWDVAMKNFRDVSAEELRKQRSADFENQMKSLFKVYDITCEALYRKYKLVGEVDKNLDYQSLKLLNDYSSKFKHNKLNLILGNVTNEINELTNRESKIRENDQIYIDILCKCKYFFETASQLRNSDDINGKVPKEVSDFIGLHQNLFRSMAICGIIDPFFKTLVTICENDREGDIRRWGASFWANKIVDGYKMLRDIKRVVKNRKDKNPTDNIDLSLLNTSAMSDELRKIYKNMDVNCDGVLIFTDTVQKPFDVEFEDDYVRERCLNPTKYSKDVIGKVRLLSKSGNIGNHEAIMEWISIYVDDGPFDSDSDDDESIDFSFLDDDPQPNPEPKQYGIWREADANVDWGSCPIGHLPWE